MNIERGKEYEDFPSPKALFLRWQKVGEKAKGLRGGVV
jgi:hypothetical protein